MSLSAREGWPPRRERRTGRDRLQRSHGVPVTDARRLRRLDRQVRRVRGEFVRCGLTSERDDNRADECEAETDHGDDDMPAWPRNRPRPHAIVVPSRNPLRKAIPFVRGRSLRMTTNVAVSTSGLAAAARA